MRLNELSKRKIGARTMLLRPPYSGVDYARLDGGPNFVETASRLGYVFAGFDVDVSDYVRTSAQITRSTLAGVDAGGRIVLLHDAGGDRQETVEALGPIIDGLRERGFRLVPTHELIGRSRADIMPVLQAHGPLAALRTGNPEDRLGDDIRYFGMVSIPRHPIRSDRNHQTRYREPDRDLSDS